MPENRLPFRIEEQRLVSDSGKEADVHGLKVLDDAGQTQEIALKEMRKVALADEQEMRRMKALYELMKNDQDFGKFVIDTHFIKAQKTSEDPAQAFLVQKFIPGKRVDKMTDEELYGDKRLMEELLEFVRASIVMLRKTESTPEQTPDLYADTENLLGNILHNPRYSGNILVADEKAGLPHRVYFIDTGTLMGPGHDKSFIKRARRKIDNRFQLAQLHGWERELKRRLEQPRI